ncbi:MAG TPA: FG-GAP-like repeat-containing protein [Usitatibacter sp.]|nr:FG-GAP-like repeat-containing protein [Usitatibacter sp.]
MPRNVDGALATVYTNYLRTLNISVPQQIGTDTLAESADNYLAGAPTDAQGRVNVLVHLSGTQALAQVANALTATGKFKLASTSARYRQGVVEGWIQVADLPAIAKVKGVRTVAMSIRPVYNIGAVTQQGVVQHRVDQIAGSYDGTGISVGALSDSFNNTTIVGAGGTTIHYSDDIASGDLPGPGNPLGNTTPVSVLQDSSDSTQSEDEGRGMLQLVHDMAPKARLAFATAGDSEQQFADNIRSLAALPGAPRISSDGFKADIIVDDVIFLNEPMFSDGIVAQAVNDVNAAGVHYFSSAGNQPSTQGYSGTFNFVDPATPVASMVPAGQVQPQLSSVAPFCTGGYHNFATDGSTDITQTLRRSSTTGSSVSGVQMMFQWDDPFDKNIPGTTTSQQTGTFTGTELTYTVSVTSGVPTRVSVFAINASAYDAIVTIQDADGNVIVDHQDTGTDENVYFTPATTGNYSVILDAFNGTTGDFEVDSADNSIPGMTTDYNLFFFDATTGALRNFALTDNVAFNEPWEFTSTFSFGTGKDSLLFVVCRAATTAPQANRIRYVLFNGNSSGILVVPGDYFSYQTPMTYGHSTAKDSHGVAAVGPFRPYIPESFSSPGPVTIVFDADGNRLDTPVVRQQPTVTAMDGGNNTFFINAAQDSASDADAFPNFFGTSAAAPNAASVAALVLQANGGPGSVSIDEMHRIMRSSVMPNDLDPNHSEAVVHVNGGTLTMTVDADASNTSAAYPFGPLDPNVIKAAYSGSGSIASITFNSQNANVTGGNVNQVFPGLVFDTRPAASGGLPFTLGKLVGLSGGNVSASFSNQAGSPSVTGQFQTMTVSFTPGTFTDGRSVAFNVDRDEQHTASLSAPATAGGNSADEWGAQVEIPATTITPGGMAFTGTMADGSTFSGTFVNKIGSGYSSLTGYGFLDAEKATGFDPNNVTLTVAATGTGAGTITSSPSGIDCPTTCTADFPSGSQVILTATPASGSYLAGGTGCDSDSAGPNTCTIDSITLPRTATAEFTLLTAPDSPTSVSALAGDGQATVSFTPPGYDGGSPITGYTVTCGTASTVVSSPPVVISGLTNGTSYSCSVVATNAAGDSYPSGSVSVTPATIPDAPSIASVTPGNGTVTVAFTANGNGGNAITSYTATCGAQSNGGASSPIVVSGLTNGVAVTCTVTATNSVGTSVASTASASVTPSSPVNLTRGDFDHDGKGDLLFHNTDGRTAIWLMNGVAIAGSAEIFPGGTDWQVSQIADLDGDGKSDLVWTNPDGRMAVYTMNGTTPTGTNQLLNAGDGWTVKHAVDLDGDGKADLIFQNTDGTLAAWLMNGTAMTSGSTLLGAGSGWSITQTGDFDGDGKKDLLFTHSDGRVAIWTMNGLTPTAQTQILNAGTGWHVSHVADLDGDGKSDIVWENDDGRVAVWLMNGTAMASGGEILGAGTGWSVKRVGDFDGDGKADLLFEHTDGRVAIYLMNGLTPTATTQILNAGSGWHAARVADVDGDGKSDIVWENDDGRIAVWLMNGTTMSSGGEVLPAGTGWAVTKVSQP